MGSARSPWKTNASTFGPSTYATMPKPTNNTPKKIKKPINPRFIETHAAENRRRCYRKSAHGHATDDADGPRRSTAGGKPRVLPRNWLRSRLRIRDIRESTRMYQHILYSVDAPVATITMNRPDNLNAFTT